MSTYGNRGMTLENLIEYANRRYKATGAAVIEKQHTLCSTPLRNGTGHIVSAKYEEKATVDYIGRFGDRPIERRWKLRRSGQSGRWGRLGYEIFA